MIDEAAFEESVEIARRVYVESGFLPALDDARLKAGQFAFWFPLEGDGPLDALLDLDDPSDPVRRAVVGAGFHRIRPEDSDEEGYETVTDTFQRFLASVDVGTLTDPIVIRWELHAAATAGDLDRVLAIGRRLEHLAPSVKHLVIIARAAFLLVHPLVVVPLTPSYVDPDIHSESESPVNFDPIEHLLALIVEPHGATTWKDPKQFGRTELDALLMIEALLGRAQNAGQSLTPSQTAIQTWCAFAMAAAQDNLSKLAAAAAAYAWMAQHLSPPDPLVSRFTFRAAALCYARALKWGDAIIAARQWAATAPDDAEAHRRLTEFLFKQQQLPEAIDEFATYVQLRKEGGNDWEASLLLELGFRFKEHRDRSATLEAAALNSFFRPAGEALAVWFSPWFAKLSKQARAKWWSGLFFVSSDDVATHLRDERWGEAAAAFGEAVAHELKERIFRPFGVQHPEVIASAEDQWKRAAAGAETLGGMIRCLAQSKEGATTAGKKLNVWLLTRPKFRQFIEQTHRNQLLKLRVARDEGQHGSATTDDARHAFTEAVRWLEALTADPPTASLQ